MDMIGGPLDGEDYKGEVDLSKPFIILELAVQGQRSNLVAMYKFQQNQLHFVETKTREQLQNL